jgi:hypothetical protein
MRTRRLLGGRLPPASLPAARRGHTPSRLPAVRPSLALSKRAYGAFA